MAMARLSEGFDKIGYLPGKLTWHNLMKVMVLKLLCASKRQSGMITVG